MVRGALPKVPTPGLAKASLSKYRASSLPSYTTRSVSLPEVFGSPIRFGRCRPPKSPRLDSDAPADMTAFSGEPLTSSTTADPFQPSSNSPASPPFPEFGNLTIGARMMRCGESKLLMPYSASRS